MLQQTQVDRVIPKYLVFVEEFPDFVTLANATVAEVLRLWQGLGYNSRGLRLKKLAEKVVAEYDCILPDEPEELVNLPGIGPATARSIIAFAFNKPVIFIETNVRTVYIHSFFKNKSTVSDDEIRGVLEQTADMHNSCKWYNALMDYGTKLKKEFGNANKKSKHYTKQTKFKGSNREVRGAIIRILSEDNKKSMTEKEIVKAVALEKKRVERNLAQLEKEGMIKKQGRKFSLA